MLKSNFQLFVFSLRDRTYFLILKNGPKEKRIILPLNINILKIKNFKFQFLKMQNLKIKKNKIEKNKDLLIVVNKQQQQR